ncbi:MATE family efflux transporter [bacterium]|nr:MATE family efflux transporter [bacterium]
MASRSMVEGAPWKHILRFAFPVLLGALLQQLYTTVDAIIVGNYAGQAALAAVGTTESFVFLFLTLSIGFSAGNGVVISQYFGAGDEAKMRASASTGIILLLGMGLGASLLGIAVSRPAFAYFVAVPPEILDMALQYFRLYSLALFFQYGYNICNAILRAVGDSAASLYFLLLASVINVALDILFVAHWGWGVSGAAVATACAEVACFAAAYCYMTRRYPQFRFKLSEYTWDAALAKKTLTVGFPIAAQMLIVSLGLTFIQRAANGFGQVMTASFAVGTRAEMYMNFPSHAFQTTLATYTGQNVGAGRLDRVCLGARQTVLMSLGVTLLIAGLVWFCADIIPAAFGLGGLAVSYCGSHLRTIAFVNIILAAYVPLFGLFQGTNHPGIPTMVATGALSVRVFVTYLFRYSAYFGHTIIWTNGLFGFGMGFLITWCYYLSNRWKKNASLINE